METQYLREFIALAENNSYLETAELLYISQTSLTRHIQALERDLGAELFVRTTRKVHLSEPGEEFLPYARSVVDAESQGRDAVSRRKVKLSDVLTIGCMPMMSQYRVTGFLARLQKENPFISVRVLEGEPAELGEMLRKGQCDFIFAGETSAGETTAGEISAGETTAGETTAGETSAGETSAAETDGEYRRIPYMTDVLAAVLPASHPLAGNASVRVSELRDEEFIMLPDNTTVARAFHGMCEAEGVEPQTLFTVQRGDSAVDFVSRGMGITVLMKQPALYFSNENTAVVEIMDSLVSHINVLYLPRKRTGRAMPAFLEFLGREI